MALPTLASIPVAPGARDSKSIGASFVGGGMTGASYTVDSPPDVVAFYAAHFGRAGEASADGTKWLFEETTTSVHGIARNKILVSVGAGPDGKGNCLVIAATVTTEKRTSTSAEVLRSSPRAAIVLVVIAVMAVVVAIGAFLLSGRGG